METMDVPGPREPASLLRAIERIASTGPARTALTLGTSTRSYGELAERSRRLAEGLAEQAGVRPGERIALLSRNRIEYFEVETAVSELSAVLVAMSWRYAAPEVVDLLAASRASVLIAEPDLADAVRSARCDEKLPDLRAIVTFGRSTKAEDLEYETFQEPVSPVKSGQRRGGSAIGRASDPHEIIYTSGTTGVPKGAVWTMRGVMANAVQQIADFRIGRECATYVAFDLNYIGGRHQFVWAMLLQGGQVHLKQSSGFDAAEIVEAVQRLEVTHLLLVPTMFSDVLDHLERQDSLWSDVRMIMCGGAPVSSALLERAQQALPRVWVSHVFGLTEGGGTVAHNPPWAPLEKRASAGIASFNVRLRVVSAGQTLGPDETGEIQVQAPTLCAGYWDDPAASSDLFDEGWLRTGDLGHLDADGYLHVTGRIKELIISGGMNIFPAEIEEVLERHADVLRAAVFGVADERWGETVAAAIEVRAGRVIDDSDLIHHCRQFLAGHKRPRHIVTVAELPRTASGKIRKSELSALVDSKARRHA